MSPGEAAFRLAFQLSPIILNGGVASFIPGQMLPIVAVTQAADFVTGLLSGGVDLDMDEFFANFRPLPGGSLVSQDVGHYPFANQGVAANAVIRKPLRLSMLMTCPARPPGGYAVKLATITALKAVLDQHNNSGGTYTVATPFYVYTNGLLLDLIDVTTAASEQPQRDWQWDFEFPLLTLDQLQQALGSLMGRINAGLPVNNAAWTGADNLPGPPSIVAPLTVPAATPLTGANVSGPVPLPRASPLGLASAPLLGAG